MKNVDSLCRDKSFLTRMLNIYKSTILVCTEYRWSGLVWFGAFVIYREINDKFQRIYKEICYKPHLDISYFPPP